jgi:hypothetical protein
MTPLLRRPRMRPVLEQHFDRQLASINSAIGAGVPATKAFNRDRWTAELKADLVAHGVRSVEAARPAHRITESTYRRLCAGDDLDQIHDDILEEVGR